MLAAFKFKTIQESKTLLSVMKKQGVSDIESCIAILNEIIEKKQIKAPQVDKRECPNCGRTMSRVSNSDGLVILGCRKCRFSRIIK